MKYRVKVFVAGKMCYVGFAPEAWASELPSAYFIFGPEFAQREPSTYLDTRNEAEFLVGLLKRETGKRASIEEVEHEVYEANVKGEG